MPSMYRNGSGFRGDGNGSHREEEIVIVGGGIGGLACALALHRVGIKAVILEQSDTLRSLGASILLWNNGFSVLDVLGVGDKLRSMFTNILAWEVLNSQGQSLAKVELADCEGGPHDLRAVERKALLEVLAGELPEETIRFGSRVKSIKKSESITELELQDGSTYSAKVVIGFDGINSCVASWMGLPKPQPVGSVGIRGVAIFPEGHKFEDKVQWIVGKGCRTGYIPFSPTKVYWYFIWNDSSQGWRDMSEGQIKEEALQRASEFFPSTAMPFIINNSPLETFSKATLRHRLNPIPESLVIDGVTVAGDAAHPTTPTLGQGGGMALEDAVILTQKLYSALTTPPPHTDQEVLTPAVPEHERIHQALVEFQVARHARTNSITTQSYRIGRAMLTGWTVVDFFRDRVVIPLSLNNNTLLAHTKIDVHKLPGC